MADAPAGSRATAAARMEVTIKIPLTRGLFALVDDDAGPEITGVKWHASAGNNGVFYAKRSVQIDGRRKIIVMHRLIMAAPSGYEVDHIDGDGLHNTRANLRICTSAQNKVNSRRKFNPEKRPYKGVYKIKKKWYARTQVDGKKITFGSFYSPEEARDAYARGVSGVYGEFARFE